MTTNTTRTLATLTTLNALRRRKGQGRPITAADILTLPQARQATGKALGGWSDDSLFITVGTLVDLYRSLTDAGRLALADKEIIGGWFGGDYDNEVDEDGAFCSTPCHDYDGGPIPSVAGFREAIEYCAEEGVVFLY